MKNKAIIIGLVLGLFIMPFLLMDLVRDWIVIPLMELINLTRDVHQLVLWILCIGLMIIPAYNSLSRWNIPVLKRSGEKDSHLGQIEVMASLLRLSQSRGIYFRKRLSQYLTEVSLKVLSYREKLPCESMEDQIKEGSPNIPKGILDYLRAGLDGNQSKKEPYDLDPVHILEFLENQLEVKHDPDNR